MKKALALLLSIIAVFSMFGIVACAAEETDTSNLVAVIFCDETGEKVLAMNFYAPGKVVGGDKFPEDPSKEATATTEYIFKGWRCSVDGELYYQNKPYTISENAKGGDSIKFTAEFAEKEITATQSFWNFVESVFARINLIFQYFAKVFEW